MLEDLQLTKVVRTALAGILVVSCAGLVGTTGEARGQSAGPVFPTLKRDYLLNGLQLIVNERKAPAGLFVRLRIDGGAAFDLAGKGGLADVTAGMLLKGGGGFDAKSVVETTAQLGLSINLAVEWDATNLTVTGPEDSLESIFDLISRLVVSPSFDQKELDALKAQRINALASEGNEEADPTQRKAMELLFGTHPYGRPVRGTAESISQITRADLLYYHKKFYLANNAALIVIGDIKAEDVTQLGRTKLGSWKKGEKTPLSFRPPEPVSARRLVVIDRASQTGRAFIAKLGISRRDKDYLPTLVMIEVLKSYASKATSGVTGTAIDAGLDGRFLPGPLWLLVTSPVPEMARSLDAVIGSMSGLQSAPPPLDPVESAKARLVSSFAERLATPDGVANVVLNVETYGLGRDYMINFADRVNAITPADVQRVAQAYLKPQSLVIVLAGPASVWQDALKKLGDVTVAR